MRLIDGDALKLEFMENGDDHTGYEIHRVIDKAPTVDAVAVCRCKDCKYGKKYNETQYQCDRFYGEWFEDDDFCSYGERKGGDE